MDLRPFRILVAQYARQSAEQRFASCTRRLEQAPHCPISRYLAGCHEFDGGRGAAAVRHMMIAHRAEPDLESAALLVFAGLKWACCPQRSLLEVLVDTWEEFRRPQFDRTRKERLLCDAFAEPNVDLQGISPLARALWRLPLGTVRGQLREVAVRCDPLEYPLLVAPA